MVLLIVDDQPGIRYLLETVAREEGFGVHTANNGLEAVEKARTTQPDLIFMDVFMPLMNGLEALGKIKAIQPKVAVVMMTAYNSSETKKLAYQKGALFCMDKPFDIGKIKLFLRQFNWKEPSPERVLNSAYATR